MGKNSNGIGAGGSGTTSSTKEEAFSYASVEKCGTVVVIGLNSSRVVQLLKSGVELCPHVQECYLLRHQPRVLVYGFATWQSVFFKFFNDCSENLTAAFAVQPNPTFLLKTERG